jgi:hypothetical protein
MTEETWGEPIADNRSLKFLTDEQLKHPSIIEQICDWWSCTLAEARDAKGAELRRRTQTTERPQ